MSLLLIFQSLESSQGPFLPPGGTLPLAEQQVLDQAWRALLPIAGFPRPEAFPDSLAAILNDALPPSQFFPQQSGQPYAGRQANQSRGDHVHGWGVSIGAPIASVATIQPYAGVHHVTGTAAISNIVVPYQGFTGSITLIPDGAFTTVTGGNIALASTAVVNRALRMTFDGNLWYPSY